MCRTWRLQRGFTWFIHHITSKRGGAEMRSRFSDGRTAHSPAQGPGVASRAVRPIASRMLGNLEASGRNLSVHCTQEMNQLAGFLAELYEAFGNE